MKGHGRKSSDVAVRADYAQFRRHRHRLINFPSNFFSLDPAPQGVALSSRFVVINREILHESPILLTPYVDKTTIDTNKLGDFIHQAYRKSNLTPEDIDTGAIIVTGEAAKKKNAEAISALFSAEAGKFVCATAGHNLESDSGSLWFRRGAYDLSRGR